VKPISKRVFKLFVVDVSDCADQLAAPSFQCHSANSCKKKVIIMWFSLLLIYCTYLPVLTPLLSGTCDKSLAY
jgi:hypothetical protein